MRSVRHGIAVDRVTTDEQSCQVNYTRLWMTRTQGSRLEGGYTFADTEIYGSVSARHRHTASILTRDQTIAIHMCDKTMPIALPRP